MYSKLTLIARKPADRSARGRSSMALLVALIITLGQINIFAHAFDIDGSHHLGDCHVCAQNQTHGHGIPVVHALLPLPPAIDFSAIINDIAVPTIFPHIPGSRAPPVDLI